MIKEIVSGPPKLKLNLPGAVSVTICPGCGHYLMINAICQVIEEMGIGDRTIHVTSIGCAGISSAFIMEDWCGCSHGTAPAVCTGIKRALKGEPIVYTVQGDGDAIAIGAGALINAATRAERITIFMGNNVSYGTTGGQMAPTTMIGQKTTTTPLGRDPKKEGYPTRVAELMAGMQGVAYSARGSVSSPANYQRTKKLIKAAFQKQIDDVGLSFVEILSQCPTGWHMKPPEAAKWVEDKMIPVFPLGEFKNVDSCD